ncbi:MAG TPA: hypothetical protein VN677_13965 [Gemmatimonadaceae bacterium]|nr:hypothetical protein [Gemmatimonadaceae bacterium]
MPLLLTSRSRRLAALHHDRAAERGGRRDELFGPDRLAAHARHLARHQVLADFRMDRLPLRRDRGPLLARLQRNERVLAEVRAELDDAARRGLDVSPAGAWLLDNYFVIQEQVREIRASMPAGYYRELPKLDAPSAFAGFPRVYELAIELISHTDGCVELQNIELLVREYQQVHPLTIGELWALPIMLHGTARERAPHGAADRARPGGSGCGRPVGHAAPQRLAGIARRAGAGTVRVRARAARAHAGLPDAVCAATAQPAH